MNNTRNRPNDVLERSRNVPRPRASHPRDARRADVGVRERTLTPEHTNAPTEEPLPPGWGSRADQRTMLWYRIVFLALGLFAAVIIVIGQAFWS